MGSAERTGRSRAASRGQTVGPSGSTAAVTAARPQSSERGGGDGADVGVGADLFEHEGPEQDLGTGARSVAPKSPLSRFTPPSMPMAGRSLTCPQSAWAAADEPKPITRSVMNAPAMAQTRRLGRNDHITHHLLRGLWIS